MYKPLKTQEMKKDIPVLKEVVEAVWRKEEELTGLKTELNNLERQIKLSLKPIEQTEGKSSEAVADNQLQQEAPKLTQSTLNGERTGVPLPHNLRQLEEVLGERLIIVSIDREDKQEKNGMPSRVCCKNERLFVFTQPLYFKYLTSQINHHHIYFEDNKKGLFQKMNYSRKRLMLLTLMRMHILLQFLPLKGYPIFQQFCLMRIIITLLLSIAHIKTMSIMPTLKHLFV